jgi:hypothetical protein
LHNLHPQTVSLIIPPLPEGGGGYIVLPLSVLPSVQVIFRRIFLSNCWWQKSYIWSQASYRYTILWVAFLDSSDSYFLFADLVGFYTHWTIFLSNYWWQRSDIWSQASYRYPISWEAFLDPSDSYFLFAEERGYHKWALAHSSSCSYLLLHLICSAKFSTLCSTLSISVAFLFLQLNSAINWCASSHLVKMGKSFSNWHSEKIEKIWCGHWRWNSS